MDGSPSRGTFSWTPPMMKPPVGLARGRHFRIPEPFTCEADHKAGETIPIRLFLGGFDLTPTFRDVNKKFSTRYYLSLVLIDEGTFGSGPIALYPQGSAYETANTLCRSNVSMHMADLEISRRLRVCARPCSCGPLPSRPLSPSACLELMRFRLVKY
jgi:hypothetical protein